jgi:hypothetical protein
VDAELADARSRGDLLFEQYLESSPTLDDTASFFQCGRQREYFGFDEDTPDDQDICDELDRLKDTPDFHDFERYANLSGASGGYYPSEFSALTAPNKRKFD